MQVARHIGLECFVGGLLRNRKQAAQIPYPVAAQAMIEARASDRLAKKLAGDGQQVIQGQQQVPAQVDDDGLLDRRQLSLLAVCGVGVVVEFGTRSPFANSRLRAILVLRQR